MESTAPTTGEVGQGPATTQDNQASQKPLDFKGTRHKVKIEDRELEVPYEELIADYQLKATSTKRFQQAAEMSRQAQAVEALIRKAQDGDLTWLKSFVKPEHLRNFAERELIELVEFENLSESEKRALLAERERDQLKKSLSERDEFEKKQKLESYRHQAEQQVDIEIAQAIKDLGYDVKVTPRLIKRIAEQMEISLEQAMGNSDQGLEPMPAKIASERAFKGFRKDVEEYLNLIPSEKLLEILPPKHREAIRKADINQATSSLPFGVKTSKADDQQIPSTPEKTKLKRMSTDEYFRRMDQKIMRR